MTSGKAALLVAAVATAAAAPATPQSTAQRIALLERKLHGWLHWGGQASAHPGLEADPNWSSCGGWLKAGGAAICGSKVRPRGQCTAIDFGPVADGFAQAMLGQLGCKVHSFHPWKWGMGPRLGQDHHIHVFGAGRQPGEEVRLYKRQGEAEPTTWQAGCQPGCHPGKPEHQCGQVPRPKECVCHACNLDMQDHQRTLTAPSKTLREALQLAGTSRVDVLRVYGHGEESGFLEAALEDMGCLPVRQLIIGWAGDAADDPRYGAGSSPSYGALAAVLRGCGMRQVWADRDDGGAPHSGPAQIFARRLPLRSTMVWMQQEAPQPPGEVTEGRLDSLERRFSSAALWAGYGLELQRNVYPEVCKEQMDVPGSRAKVCLSSLPETAPCVIYEIAERAALRQALAKVRPHCTVHSIAPGSGMGSEQRWTVESVDTGVLRPAAWLDCHSDGTCRPMGAPTAQVRQVHGETLQEAMTRLGHSTVHLLFVDAAGAEWRFLEHALHGPPVRACPKVKQISVVWHGDREPDVRYGDVTSNSAAVADAFEACGYTKWWQRYPTGSRPELNMRLLRTAGVARRVQAVSYLFKGGTRQAPAVPSRIVSGTGSSRLQVAPLDTEERVTFNELRINAFLSWGRIGALRPQGVDATRRSISECTGDKSWSNLGEYDPACKRDRKGQMCTQGINGLYDHPICLGLLPKDHCMVLDIGIRQQPQFGMVLTHDFGCKVRAYDPSPVAQRTHEWMDGAGLRDHPRYKYFPVGAGGHDGEIVLSGYNWEQVSIYASQPVLSCLWNGTAPCRVYDPRSRAADRGARFPVQTLGKMMRDAGLFHIDVLKIDVEGSEFAFLEQAVTELGCIPATQMALEWHHFGNGDPRYGGGSSPHIAALNALMNHCGMKQLHAQIDDGWSSGDDMRQMGASFMYNLAHYVKLPHGSRSR